MNENLLIVNFLKTKSQEENYTTEAFVSLLRYLVDNESRFAWSLFNLLTQRKFNLKDYTSDKVVIRSQVTTSFGRPDIEVAAPGYLIYIENKIEARMEKNQIQRYKRALRRSGNKKTLLLLISKYRMRSSKGADYHIRWYQIANWLESSSSRLKSRESHMKVIEFLDFLRYRYLAPESADRQVATLLKEYLLVEGKDSLYLKWMNRASDLGDHPNLEPLRKLLNVMAFSIERAYPNEGFGFANFIQGINGERSGIGFNIAYKHDFFIDTNQPEILFFKSPVKLKRSSRVSKGNGEIIEIANSLFWIARMEISTTDVAFFTKSFDEQVKSLHVFLKENRRKIKKYDNDFCF